MASLGKTEFNVYSNGKVVASARATWGSRAEATVAKKLGVNPNSLFALPKDSSYIDEQIAIANSKSRFNKFGA